MTDPERALEQARSSLRAMRDNGAYADDTAAPEQTTHTTHGKLLEWALIEPDLRDVRSTRRFGAPMTAFKHGLLRLLQQYHAELNAQQTRFNVAVLGQLEALEERLDALERRLDADKPPQ
jgi:hypothetical protein